MSITRREYVDYKWTGNHITEHVGTTLCDREENYYDDSDGYSHVYDVTAGKVIRVGTWTTRAQSDTAPGVVDAYDVTGEHYDAMRAWHIEAVGNLVAVYNGRKNREAMAAAFTPQKGDYVRVARGRKVPVGIEGTVIWAGERSYSQWQAKYGKANLRVGIKDADGNVHWTDASNVDMVDEPVYTLLSEDPAVCAEAFKDADLRDLHAVWCRGVSALRYL